MNHHQSRLLQGDSSTSSTVVTAPLTETEILRSTCMVYMSIFAALFLLFLYVRPRYPHIYNIKKSYPALNASVANDHFGRFSWIWEVFSIDYNDICEQCGMDAVTTIRLFELGVKLSLVGVFNSCFLVPIYAFKGNVVASSGVSDPIFQISLSNLDQGHYGTMATTLAAYIFFASVMYFIHKDFEWFTLHRHNFLSKRRVTNYSLFLSGIPPEMRTNKSIRDYFGKCFSHDAVADVDVALIIPKLEKKVAKRDALLPKLEHAINIMSVKGERPTHKSKICGGKKVESIPTYEKLIKDLNEEISSDIDKIQTMQWAREAAGSSTDNDVEAAAGERETPVPPVAEATREIASYEAAQTTPDNEASEQKNNKAPNMMAISATLKSLMGGEDGAPRSAAFITFADLASTNLARQAVHNHEPWFCVPKEPPSPDQVNWNNVGKSNMSKQIGELISLVLTASLCIFWTVPVSFVASLGNVEVLTDVLPFLKWPVENYAWFSELMAVLAPLLLVVFISLLPYIILFIIKFECLIEIETLQHPSLFAKLAAFTILQTFFISTIASTLFSSLQDIIKNPSFVFTLLAEALPSQAAYFIQIIIVQNLLALGIALLRLPVIGQNFARKILSNKLGFNLTEKERNQTFMGLRSLDDPLEWYFGTELGSKAILIFMVLFVYSCMAPITSYFTLLVFGLLAIGYRHQFIFIYPISNDSGGKLWLNFIRLVIICMVTAEIVLFVVLLLKESFIAAVLLLPLVVFTVFWSYIKERHYDITKYLPLGDCAVVDSENESERMAHEWLRDAYLQPALKKETSAVSAGEREHQTSSRELSQQRVPASPGDEKNPFADEIGQANEQSFEVEIGPPNEHGFEDESGLPNKQLLDGKQKLALQEYNNT